MMDVKIDRDDFIEAFSRVSKAAGEAVMAEGTYAAAKVAANDLRDAVPERTGKLKKSIRIRSLDRWGNELEESHKASRTLREEPVGKVGHVVLMGQDKYRRWADAFYAPFLELGTGTRQGNHLMKRTAEGSVPQMTQAFIKAVRKALRDLEE